MSTFFRKAAGYVLQGLLFLTPIGVTIFVVVWFVRMMDNLFSLFLAGSARLHYFQSDF
jgi:uncharacterized membrane protein